MAHSAESRSAADKPGRWERIDDYLRPIRRRGSGWRRRLSARPGHEQEPERALLSTLPFVALLAGLALLTVILFTLAVPGNYSRHAPRQQSQAVELGTAPPGWIDGKTAPDAG